MAKIARLIFFSLFARPNTTWPSSSYIKKLGPASSRRSHRPAQPPNLLGSLPSAHSSPPNKTTTIHSEKGKKLQQCPQCPSPPFSGQAASSTEKAQHDSMLCYLAARGAPERNEALPF
jgi:hypothetical protein